MTETKQKKLTDWSNEPTIADLDSDYKGGSSSRIAQVAKIDDWIDLLNATGKYAPVDKPGRSKVQPRVAKKQAEWRYSALSEPFLNSPDLFQISPRAFKDRLAASENELVLNYQFNVQMDKVKFIDEYVRTVVDQGTVILKTEWLYADKVVTRDQPVFEYIEADPVTAQEIAMMMQTSSEQLTEEQLETVLASEENGRPILATLTGYEEVEVIETAKNQPYVSICDYRNITIDPTCQGDFSKAQFVIHSYEVSKADLVKQGIYSNLDQIQFPTDTAEHTQLDNNTFYFQDDARKMCTVHEYWGFWDIDGEGKTVAIVAAWVKDTLIRLEENPLGELPFEVVAYTPVYKSVYGEPDAALLVENQAIIGAITRGMIDSMAKSANAQVGMRKDALDTVNKRKFKTGDDYEFSPAIVDSRAAIIQHSYPELPSSTFNMLTLFGQEAEGMTGVKSWTGGDAQLGNTAAAVNGVLGAASKRELNILRRLSSGLEKVARKILVLNSLFLADEEIIRITDEEFVSISRENLKGSFDVKIAISTAEADGIKAQELAFMLQTIGQSLPFELTKVILSEISKLRQMPDLAKMIEQYQPQPDPMYELELQKAQLENSKIQLEIAKVQAETASIQAKAVETQAKATKVNLDTVEQEKGVTQARELELMQAQAEGNAKRDIMKSAMDAALKTKPPKQEKSK